MSALPERNLARVPVPGGHPKRRSQPEWMRDVKVGDVLLTKSGKERVVRDCYFYSNGDLAGVTFAIMRCSWTGRCDTHMNYTDLKTQGYAPKGVSVPLETELDAKILWCIVNHRQEDQVLGCCDVKGVP